MVVRNLRKSEQQCWRGKSSDNDRHFHRSASVILYPAKS